MPRLSPEPRTARLVHAYAQLTHENLPALLALYGTDAAFKDPFNEVRGRAAVERIFRQMFEELQAPRFVVQVSACEGDDAFLTWDFHFKRGSGQALTIRGATHLRFSATGLVAAHRDYWDAAEELYAKLPLLGALMRALRRKLGTPQP